MCNFTVWGFKFENGEYFNFNSDIFAETPPDAIEKMLAQNLNLVVSNVCRSHTRSLLFNSQCLAAFTI